MKVSLDALLNNTQAMKKARKPAPSPKEAVDIERKQSISTAPSTWSRTGSTLTSKLNKHISFPFEARSKKKKNICTQIRSVFTDIPRIVEVPKEPEFVVVLVEDEQDVENEEVEATLIRNTNRFEPADV
jgi:hypothetical protein